MKAKIFYRIEDKDSGEGMYECGLVTREEKLSNMRTRHENVKILPNSWSDEFIRIQMRDNPYIYFIFCFTNESDMLRLVTKKELQDLVGLGCKIYKIESKDYFSSKFQTIVNRDTIISKVDVTYLYD